MVSEQWEWRNIGLALLPPPRARNYSGAGMFDASNQGECLRQNPYVQLRPCRHVCLDRLKVSGHNM